MNGTGSLVNHEELDRFEESVRAFLNHALDAERLQSIRLQQGVYGQRQEGVQMVRVKIPGGRMTPDQLETVAGALETYSPHDVAHITTRQDIQIHYVPLAKTPAALKDLARGGLTTREACNNTVRNVSCCPLAGLCSSERVDIRPVQDHAMRYFLRHPLTQHLPRKFKISFSGCESDCAQGMIHDLAVVAIKKDGRFGFKLLAGGGLGHKPRKALTVEEFIPEEALIPCMEAVISLHNRYSNRKQRAKSRIKFLVDRFGPEGFIEKYKEELTRTRTALAGHDYVRGQWTDGRPAEGCNNPGAPRRAVPQKQPGLWIFPIRVPIGDITAPQLRGIAALMRREGLSDVRTTQDQNIVLAGVPEARIGAIREELARLGLGEPRTGDDVVACPGASTCRLGITASKKIGLEISGGEFDLRVRASGCHNGCAQPETGDIGIYGEGKRLHGKLVPHYQMYLGGDGRNGGDIAVKGPSVPAARVQQAIQRVQDAYAGGRLDGETFFAWSHRQEKDYFARLLADLATVAPEEIATVLRDHGDELAFKVEQFGGGECAGAAQETVAANFAEAANERNYRNGFLFQRKYEESIECAQASARLVGQSLLFLAGEPPVDDLSGIGRRLSVSFPAGEDLGRRLIDFAARFDRLKEAFDEAAYRTLTQALDQWTAEAAAISQDIDRQLDLGVSVPTVAAAGKKNAEDIDLTAFGCPLHYVKARNELRRVTAGATAGFLFGSEQLARQAAESLRKDGHEILSVQERRGGVLVHLRKSAPAEPEPAAAAAR
ncbi:MAG: nitrite/sulfite reductase [Gammaproteobacteria bacterium]|nr:nitrite/sulfite reductase [Gammaproteobacteria bacterium]